MTVDVARHASSTEQPRPAGKHRTAAGRLWVRVTYPEPESVVVSVGGELDAAGLPRLQEALWPRVSAAVGTLVVDLSAVEFLGIAGLDLLNQARLRASDRGLALRLVTSGHEVCRAVHVAGLGHLCRASLTEALARTSSTTPSEHRGQTGQGGGR